MVHQESAGDDARAENHDGCEDDFPVIHWAWSPWSTEARSVVSRFWERSSPELLPGFKNTHAPHKTAITIQLAAACHNPRTHNATLSFGLIPGISAITRFSKAYGTRSPGALARAAAISFR